jgi:hypothetical protein
MENSKDLRFYGMKDRENSLTSGSFKNTFGTVNKAIAPVGIQSYEINLIVMKKHTNTAKASPRTI